MSNESQEEPKLIIDEDWKSQVEREKEELKRQAEQGKSGESESIESESTKPKSAASAAEAVEATGTSDEIPPPPASFSFLLTTLATQAMAALGQMPGEDGQSLPVNLDYARHFIDMMGVLEEKTTGNLDEAEENLLKEALHQMRMMFVAVSQQSQSTSE